MKLNNIKVSFIFENNVVKDQNKQIIWKNGNFTFTIYKHNRKLVNVTGLKSAEEIEQQKKLIEEMFQQKVKKERIDNTFFSKKDYKNIDMPSLYKHLKENKDYFVSYNIELFPGMYLHPKDKQYPTMILFRTGSYTMMGGKSIKVVYESELFLKTLIEKYLICLKGNCNTKNK
jgi:TATA-box binding protein (TBP) (component of TFIID and TFIIIB)